VGGRGGGAAAPLASLLATALTRAIAELYRRRTCEVELESTSQACRR